MNSAWVKKMTARFHALDLNKDGVLTKADFDIFTERTIQIGKLSEAQAERNWKLHNEIVSVFGGENLKLTLADFIQAQAKYSTGTVRVIYSVSIIHNILRMSSSSRRLPINGGK